MNKQSSKDIDEQKQPEWQQGDCVISEEAFVFRFDPSQPATSLTKDLSKESEDIYAEDDAKGFVVLTQTCDLVRPLQDRPYVEIAPLVELNQEKMALVSSRMMPQYAEVPSISDRKLVADLDRVMTIEKPVLRKWERVQGCRNDNERRLFSEALARKRARPALPDDFVDFLKKLQTRWKDKHDKDTDEGRSLRCLREIRVQPSPDWNANPVTVRFWMLLDPRLKFTDQFDRAKLELQIKEWMGVKYLRQSGTRFKIDHWTGHYEDMSAKEYIASDRLDYDHLSS